MDDDKDSSNWILVEEVDCCEEALTPPASTDSTGQESDQESDGSISVISEFPNDSFSEEETSHTITSGQVFMKENVKEAKEVQEDEKSDQSNDDDMSSNFESSNKLWTFVDNKSKLELATANKPFFLDCSQEPILEISDIDTESTSSGPECKTLVEQEIIPNISHKTPVHLNNNHEFSLIRNGMFISFIFLSFSVLVKFYIDSTETNYYPTSNTIPDSTSTNEKDIVDLCVQKYKEKSVTDEIIEKCVKSLNKKKKDIFKRSELYLEMKERVLELKEKELAEKEKQIFRKWRKRIYINNLKKENYKLRNDDSKHENDEKIIHNKKLKRKYVHDNINLKKKQVNKDKKNWKHFHCKTLYKKINNEQKHKKQFKGKEKNKKEPLTKVKDKIKNEYGKLKSKYVLKDKHDEKEEEWYIKYNPIKNTIELINITNLPDQDSALIRNGNKTINGQWYFSLYGFSRSDLRNREKSSEWYFRRSRFREYKRDKAKWYFDYMSARDHYRWLY